MKTLYEILEVSESASNEIIEKAYKVLAKKNHPDLQPEGQKQKAEQVMKQINEAYSVLSDEFKRKQYDEKLKIERQNQEEQRIKSQYQNTYSKTNTVNKTYQEPKTAHNAKQEIKLEKDILKKKQKEMQAQYEQKYQEAYEDYLRRLGYKIKYKWTWKNYRNLLITIVVIMAIGAIVWYFPPTHQMLVDFYESNKVIKTIIDVIGSILVGIWNAIASIFK